MKAGVALRLAWLAMIAAIGVGTACSREPAKNAAPPASSTPAPSAASYQGDLPPLPQVQFAFARPEPITRAAYEFAARYPDVLRYMPCFCGCERHGHGNNEDCFVAKRETGGRPVWNPHGIGCGICIDVAREAARLHKSGVPLDEVRADIERKYRSEYPTSTPTPAVPRTTATHH